ncbi:hypothetical protein BDV39DRAFT_196251 [Aspergillus sergii]|uniref:Uncharacterized protein n=1 Tax=Aspergillus sergii TaxID=1034303 RepID=A0A5N6WQ57_9EURO|nr:hypothetical protein BDV39DRAFT_196251 [Aspergillus sergii]
MSTWSSTTSDGSLIRTGMGALPNPKADKSKPPHEQEPNENWQLFDNGLGPHSAGNDSDQIVETLRPLRISGVIQNTPKLENVLVSAALGILSKPSMSVAGISMEPSCFSKIPGAKFYFPEDRPNDIALQTASDTMQAWYPIRT